MRNHRMVLSLEFPRLLRTEHNGLELATRDNGCPFTQLG